MLAEFRDQVVSYWRIESASDELIDIAKALGFHSSGTDWKNNVQEQFIRALRSEGENIFKRLR